MTVSDQASISLHRASDRQRLHTFNSMTVPRIGEEVGLSGKWWRVVNVWYLYPMPGSTDYNMGFRRPLVELGVEEVDNL